jgi:hypothetical protein
LVTSFQCNSRRKRTAERQRRKNLPEKKEGRKGGREVGRQVERKKETEEGKKFR